MIKRLVILTSVSGLGACDRVESNLPAIDPLAQATPAYQHIVIDPSPGVHGSDTLEKALVDINGDGRLDAVLGEGAVNGGPGGLYWYQAPSSGGLTTGWTRHVIAASGNFYEDIKVFDFNGDHAPDLVASDNDQVVWFQNPRGSGGDPTQPWPMHTIRTDGGAHSIAIADLDGDGRADVVVSSSSILGSSGAILFQNNPDSWSEVPFGNIGESVALLDIASGLGRVNIAGGDGNSVVWYENPREHGGSARTGSWTRHVAASLPSADDAAMASGVFSSSGAMDLIAVANENTSVTGLYRIVAPGNRRGAWSVQTIDPTYQAAHMVSVGDMDNDGSLDFVVGEQEQAHNFSNQRVAVFYNDGNGNFTQQVIATTGGQNQVLGDIDGDGDLDILSANHGYYHAPNPLEIWLNEPATQGMQTVQDPGFEDSGSLSPFWSVGGGPPAAGIDTNPSHAHSGSHNGFIWDGGGAGKWVDLTQSVSVAPNSRFTLTAWVDASHIANGGLGVWASNGGTIAYTPLANTDPGPVTNAADYRQYSATFNSGNNSSVWIYAGYTTSGSASFINVDDVTFAPAP